MAILKVFVVLYITIFIHELGHYLAYKKFGVNVEKFSVGTGPKLKRFRNNNTEFIFSLIPFVGAVQINEEDYKDASLFQHLIVCFAGVFFNLLSALISMFILAQFNITKYFTVVLPKIFEGMKMIIIEMTKLSTYISPDLSLENITPQVAEVGGGKFLHIFLAVNIAVALFNLIPIPVLDGGRAIIEVIRSILKKIGVYSKKIDKIINYSIYVSFILLCSLPLINELLNLLKKYNYISVIGFYVIIPILVVLMIKEFKDKSISRRVFKQNNGM